MTNRRMQGLLEWLDGERLVASGHRAATIENHLKNALEVDKILNERPPSLTPETDAALNGYGATLNPNILDFARSLERRLSLAQTEIKGHMRVEDELRAEVANVTRLEFYWLEQAKLIGERYEQAEARCAAAYEAAAKIAEPKSGNPESAWEQGYWAAENSISKEIRALSQVPSVSDASALEKRPAPLADELEQAQAHIAELRKDAARYRWLREHFRFSHDNLHELWFDENVSPHAAVTIASREELDATIDEAALKSRA